MKQFLILLLIFIAALYVWAESDQWTFDHQKYLSKEVLELSTPIDVKIDTELLNSLKPAINEQ